MQSPVNLSEFEKEKYAASKQWLRDERDLLMPNTAKSRGQHAMAGEVTSLH